MPAKTKTVKRSGLGRITGTSRQEAALKAAALALALVEKNALYWVEEGARGDEPGSAKEAYELLMRHGYYHFMATNLAPASLARPDGSKVVR